MTRLRYTILFLLVPLGIISGQDKPAERFFQVTGLITDEENKALPNVGIISFMLRRGAISEKTGIYSISSTPGDTIFFRALGFKKRYIVLPVDFDGRLFTLDVTLTLDTIPIENVIVMPWKTYSEFIKDMTKTSPVPPEIENMNKNLESITEAVASTRNVRITPEAAYRYAMQQNFNMTATRNQGPVNNLLNPFAWAKFVNGIKNGLFRNAPADKAAKKTKPSRKKKKK